VGSSAGAVGSSLIAGAPHNRNDAGAGSLRDAIANANAGDTIEFDMSLSHVTSPITPTGSPFGIAQNLTIQAARATCRRSDGGTLRCQPD
jgi:hypothetical protein